MRGGPVGIGRAAVPLFFGVALTVITAIQLTETKFARGNESAQRQLAGFYLYDDISLTRSAIDYLIREKEPDLIAVSGIYRELLGRDSASPSRWCDLGAALVSVGQMQKAERCFLRAVQLGNNVPKILRELADFYVKAGKYRESLPYFGRILSILSEFDSIVFDYFDEMKLSAQDLGEGGALPTARAANAYFRQILSAGNSSAAKDLWNWIAGRAYADDSVAVSYVDFLLQRGLKDDALNAWAAYTGERNQGYSESTFIYNGGFELKPSGSRLDWRIDSLDHVSVARDSTIAHSGAASLRMQFDGKENIDFHHITQELVLPPGAYELAAYIRTRDLSTDEGISLRLASSEPGFALDVNTEAVSGTAHWKRVARSFSIPSHSRMLILQICRRQSLRFDNQISGAAWIDSIVIKRDLR